MPKLRHPLKQRKTKKVRVRNMYDHLQGDTVKAFTAKDLPTGCSQLKEGGYPCTARMSHVDVKFERMWVPSEQAEVQVLKIIGCCRTHRSSAAIALPDDTAKTLNGPRSQKARIRRMEDAIYVRVVPNGGTRGHLTPRDAVRTVSGSPWVTQAATLCGMTLKQAYLASAKEMREDYDPCPKCDIKKEVINEEL